MKLGKDYYQTLGVSPKATSTEIRRAYRRLAILNHPDRNPSTQTTLQMQEINEAYSVLGNKRKRLKYDSERSNFTAASQTASAPRKTTAPLNLQQILAEDAAPRIGLRSIVMTIVVLMLSVSFLVWSLAELNWEIAGYAFFILVLIFVSMGGIFFLWRSHKFSEFEAQCPKCGKAWAAEKLSEKLVGVSRKKDFITLYLNNKPQDTFTIYERFKIHYRCKYCFYEWQFIKTKGQSIL